MTATVSPDIIVFVCHRNIPRGVPVPRQWKRDGIRIVIREMPCSGKMDGQYLMHAFEGGARGVCVIACPKGECRLSQGNYRAEVRVRTIKRLLAEIGMDPQRAELYHLSADDPPEKFSRITDEFVGRICALGDSQINIEKNSVPLG